MKPIICVGHAALDYVYRIEAFPPEPTKVRSLEHIESGGGMAANAAATIARLGGRVELWSRTGADSAGQRIHAFLEADGVDTRFVRTYEGARSSTSAVIVDQGGERLIIGERDHAMSMDSSWLPLERIAGAAAVLSDLRWVEGHARRVPRGAGARRADVARCRSGRRRRPARRIPVPRRLRDILRHQHLTISRPTWTSGRSSRAYWRLGVRARRRHARR